MELNIKLITSIALDIVIIIQAKLKSLTLHLNATWSKDKDPVNKFWTWQIIY